MIQSQAASIVESLSAGIVLIDENLRIVGMNGAAENILGVSKFRSRGKHVVQVFDDEPELRDVLLRVMETGDPHANEIRLAPETEDGDERVIDCRVSLAQVDGAEVLMELNDITRRARISRENALLIQHGAGRQMIRQLAHEIKNPLGGIRGSAQLLERELPNDEQREFTDVIISETDRLAALVDTLLGPGGPPKKERVNVHELLEYVIRIVQADEFASMEFRRDYDPGLPLLDLDRDQMIQAFLNLVRNAAQANKGQGKIKLRTRAVTNFTIGDQRHRVIASIEVKDYGPGIPPDLQDSIFFPLVTTHEEGTGLGLPAAQELISRHGGLIEFESRPGHTVFFVRLPITEDST